MSEPDLCLDDVGHRDLRAVADGWQRYQVAADSAHGEETKLPLRAGVSGGVLASPIIVLRI
jgi:hypothetical protein